MSRLSSQRRTASAVAGADRRERHVRPRLAVARLWHEGNSNAPLATGLDDFVRREWLAGESALAFYRGTRTELGAATNFATQNNNWALTFLRCAAAPPGGPVEQSVLDGVIDEIVLGLSGGQWAGVYLSLHGALIGTAEQEASPDVRLLRAVRSVVGAGTPIAVTFDLHANLDPEVADLAEIVVGYKTYPHVDMYETAEKALSLLTRTVAREISPVSRVVKAGALLPSHRMTTGHGPMGQIVRAAAELESRDGLLDVSVFGGFAYGAGPHLGAGASACVNEDGALAERTAAEMAGRLRRAHRSFALQLPTAQEGLTLAVERLRAGVRGPVAVLEPADNPLSGGLGDTPTLFRALLALGVACRTVFAFFCDPDLVARCRAIGEGAPIKAPLGGRLTDRWGMPVEFAGHVERLTDGRFVNLGPMEAGLACDIGPTAVLRRDRLRVVITSTSQSPNDLAWFQLHGLDLAETDLLCVKAKNHFRAAFSGLCGAIIEVDSPGPAGLVQPRLLNATEVTGAAETRG